MKTITELVEKWNSIKPYTDGFLLISDDHPLSFHIGIYGENEKVFIVLNTGKIDGIASSKAVAAENIKLENGSYALRFSLKLPSLDELFIKLCWDLMEASREAANPLDQFLLQYKKWQRLLQKISDGGLSVSIQKGLIGELLFLKERAEIDGIDTVLPAWVGPEGADQDFDFPDFWAEVKSTSIAGNSVTISSLQQLDRTDEGYLIVFFMDKTTSNSPSGVSLASIAAEIEELLTTDKQKNVFACKLARLGYQNKDKQKYNTHRFRVAERRIYSVSSQFPKLTKDLVPPAVTEAKYEIDLASISLFEKKEF